MSGGPSPRFLVLVSTSQSRKHVPMNTDPLRQIQALIKARCTKQPDAARHRLRADGMLLPGWRSVHSTTPVADYDAGLRRRHLQHGGHGHRRGLPLGAGGGARPGPDPQPDRLHAKVMPVGINRRRFSAAPLKACPYLTAGNVTNSITCVPAPPCGCVVGRSLTRLA
jgi:hypothetical protein